MDCKRCWGSEKSGPSKDWPGIAGHGSGALRLEHEGDEDREDGSLPWLGKGSRYSFSVRRGITVHQARFYKETSTDENSPAVKTPRQIHLEYLAPSQLPTDIGQMT